MSNIRIKFPLSPGIGEVIKYPAGESQVRLSEGFARSLSIASGVTIRARLADYGLLNGRIVELLLLNDAIRGVTSAPRVLEIPYLPYGRGDRRFVDGDCHGLATFGEIINTAGFSEVRTLDVHHFSRSAGFIRNFVNIEPDTLIRFVMNSLVPGFPLTVLLPDKGALERYLHTVSSADNQKVRPEFTIRTAEKERDTKTGKFLRFAVPEITMPHVLIVDDICDGGGTFLGIAKALRSAGYTGKLHLYVTHGIFSKGFGELLDNFETIWASNSINHALRAEEFRVVLLDAFAAMEMGERRVTTFPAHAV